MEAHMARPPDINEVEAHLGAFTLFDDGRGFPALLSHDPPLKPGGTEQQGHDRGRRENAEIAMESGHFLLLVMSLILILMYVLEKRMEMRINSYFYVAAFSRGR